MIRKVLLMVAVAAPLVLGSQQSASAMNLVTTKASSNIEVKGTEFNFFNQNSNGLTSFNDGFSKGISSLTFPAFAEAVEAVEATRAVLPASDFSPTTPSHFVPLEASRGAFRFVMFLVLGFSILVWGEGS